MNPKPILVTYATMSGSTQEIAEAICRELESLGQPAVLQHCRQVASLDGYRAVVAGAPMYMFHLHKDALRFFQRHQRAIAALPVAVFAGGAYGPNAEADAVEVQKNLQAELAKITWLRPASVLLVGGRFDPARLRFPYNLIPALKQAPPSDARDWDQIRGWARNLPGVLCIQGDAAGAH